jgi:hypothetical protein
VIAKVPEPASRFGNPTSVLYVAPWLPLRWTGSRDDQALPFVLAVPMLVLSAIWLAIRLIAYPVMVVGRLVTLRFRSRPAAHRTG